MYTGAIIKKKKKKKKKKQKKKNSYQLSVLAQWQKTHLIHKNSFQLPKKVFWIAKTIIDERKFTCNFLDCQQEPIVQIWAFFDEDFVMDITDYTVRTTAADYRKVSNL